jgi:hypothetical protein
MYATNRFWGKLTKDDATPQRRLMAELRVIAKGQGSSKNRSFLTEGRVGQAAKELGITLQKDRLSKSGRLIHHKGKDGKLHLIDYDWDHTSVDELESQSVATLKKIFANQDFHPELDEFLNAPQDSWRSGIQLRSGGNRDTYVEELYDDWIRFLDREQQELRDQLFRELVGGTAPPINLILGAAGTGKTMVLLDLAHSLIKDAGTEVDLKLPSGVREYLAKSEEEYWFQKAKSGQIVLLDDPKDFESMEREIHAARASGKVVVVSIDPTQWTHKRTRDQFWTLLQKPTVKTYELRTAYRQGGAVGTEALAILSSFYNSASMFADPNKVSFDQAKGKYWEDLCLREARHVDDKGTFSVHGEVNTVDELERLLAEELEEVMKFETERRWPKLLVGTGVSQKLPQGVTGVLADAQSKSGLKFKVRSFDEVEKVRGTEFESVILFLGKSQFLKINQGPTALGAIDYQQLTRPLTFLTRAENRLTIFVLKDSFPHLLAK